MSGDPTPHELAAAARGLMRDPSPRIAGLWPRLAAVLARQSIELSLGRLWQLRAPGLQHTSRHCQLLCLPVLLGDAELGRGVHLAWEALSRALHHHPYELAPVYTELLGWIDTSERLAGAVDGVLADAAPRRSAAPPQA